MKTLSTTELELLQGSGSGKDILDAACIGVGAVSVGVTIAKVALGPIGTGITIGCGAYAVGRGFGWW